MIKSSKKKINPSKNKDQQLSLKNQENQDIAEDLALRPSRLDQYIGQGRIKRQLNIILNSSKIRKVLPEHILFYGQPGLGKTTLANIISQEMGLNFKVISAPSLQKTGDIVSLLINLESKTLLFIDEIHRLKAPLEETLYTALEDRRVDIIMGKGQGASSASVDLNEFTLIGATTQLGHISKPLKDRFPTIFQLESYNSDEIKDLLERNCKILGLNLQEEAKNLVCQRSRGVPRVANNLLKRLLDLQTVKSLTYLDYQEVENFLVELGIFENGLTRVDIKYLQSLLQGPLGLKTLAGILLEDLETLEYVSEPYLIYLGYIQKDSSGRKLTPIGREFILRFG